MRIFGTAPRLLPSGPIWGWKGGCGQWVQPLAHSFAHSQERGHKDKTATAAFQPGKKLTPPPKTRENPLQTHRRGFKTREFGGHTSTVGENRGWMGRSIGVAEFDFLFIFVPYLKVIQGRRHNPGEFCNCDRHGRRFCME